MSGIPEDWTSERYALTGTVRPGALGIRYFAALDRETELAVMVKAMRTDEVPEDWPAQFAAEGAALAQLQHPSLLRLLDTGCRGPWAFHVYELGTARTLREVLSGGAVGLSRALSFADQLVAALTDLHGRGMTHGLLHPNNLLVGLNDQLKVTGFSLGWRERPVALPYAAPEQLEGVFAPAGDVFQVGTLLFELLTGTRYVRADGLQLVEGFDPARLEPGTPRWLLRLLARLLERSATERPTADEVADELEGRAPPPGLPVLLDALDPLLSRKWPAPLPRLLSDLALLRSPALACFRLLDVVEVAIKLGLAAYWPAASATLPDRPSFGHWCAALRAAAPAGIEAATLQELDRAVHVRNVYRGHGSLGRSELYEAMLEQFAQSLLSLPPRLPLARLTWQQDRLALDGTPAGAGLAQRARCPTCGETEAFLFNSRRPGRTAWLAYESGHVWQERTEPSSPGDRLAP